MFRNSSINIFLIKVQEMTHYVAWEQLLEVRNEIVGICEQLSEEKLVFSECTTHSLQDKNMKLQ